jgi:type IV pilus assembly protein PilC
MASFTYLARDPGGRTQRGQSTAVDASSVAASLRQRGWMVIDVRAAMSASPTAGQQLAQLSPARWMPIRSADIELSLHQLAVLLRGGLTLLAAIRAITEQTRRYRLRQTWSNVSDRIRNGSSLADALVEHRCFSPMLVQLIRVGEQTGNLEQVVLRGAETLERRRNLLSSLLTALAYPSLVLVAAIGVTAFMLVSVIPKLKVFLDAMGRKLPAMTQFLVDLAEAIQIHGPYVAIGLVALTAASYALYSWPPGRYAIDRAALRVPLVGGLFRLAATATFARGVATLIRSGVTLLESLRTVEQLHRNRYLREYVSNARESVMQGGTLAEPLRGPYTFMPMLPAMVAIGESTGTLDDVLDEVARFHETLLERAIRRLSIIIEPVIIIVVGSIVGFVYISFFMALFSASGAVH